MCLRSSRRAAALYHLLTVTAQETLGSVGGEHPGLENVI